MPRQLLEVALAAATFNRARADDPWTVRPDSNLQISTDGGATFVPASFVEAAAWGPALDGVSYNAYYPPMLDEDPAGGFGCVALPQLPPSRSVYVLARGNCSFASKALNAQAAGAAAVLVYDSVPGAYWASLGPNQTMLNASSLAAGKCYFNCAVGAGTVTASEATNITAALAGFPGRCGGGCGSPCLLTGSITARDAQVCCMVDSFIPMSADEPSSASALASLPGAFAPASVGVQLLAALTQNGVRSVDAPRGPLGSGAVDQVVVALGTRPTPAMDPSYGLMILLGCVTAAVSSFYAGWPERLAIRYISTGETPPESAPGGAGGSSDAHPEVQELTLSSMGCLLVCVAIMLGGLYALLQVGVQVIYLVFFLFFIGAGSAVNEVLARPLISKLAPRLDRRVLFSSAKWGMHTTAGGALGQATGMMVTGLFLALRHESWSWAPQDFLGLLLCSVCLTSIRVSSLKTATLALCCFLGADVFAVLITPYLFGSSVMMDVATAGTPRAYPFGDQACYCRYNPGDSTFCGATEYMPILLRLPVSVDYRGGYVMLGLGDIIMPGIALAMCLRQDYYCKRATAPLPGRASNDGILARFGIGTGRGIGYYPVALIGYAVGLSLANAAVVIMRLGQPALLYLVPCVLIPVIGLAQARGELPAWWSPREDIDLEGDAHGTSGGGRVGEEGAELGVLHSAREAVSGIFAPHARSAAQARSNSLLASEFSSGGRARVDSDDSTAGQHDRVPLQATSGGSPVTCAVRIAE